MAEVVDFFLRPSTLIAGKFEAPKYKIPIFTVLKVLNSLKKYVKNQEASYNFRLGIALSNRPHLHRAH